MQRGRISVIYIGRYGSLDFCFHFSPKIPEFVGNTNYVRSHCFPREQSVTLADVQSTAHQTVHFRLYRSYFKGFWANIELHGMAGRAGDHTATSTLEYNTWI
jgi:hypothetical protein